MEHITINSDRSVTVPVELRKIGVQYDHNVNTIEFVGPRYSSNVDLSTMTIYINYILSDKTPGKYKAENVIIDDQDDSLIRFNWTITRNVTKVSGILSCLVCAKKTDEEGNEINHWNTDIFRLLSVSEGMENDLVIQEQYPDIITSLIHNVNEHDAKLLEFSGLDTRVTDIENNVNELKGDLGDYGRLVKAKKEPYKSKYMKKVYANNHDFIVLENGEPILEGSSVVTNYTFCVACSEGDVFRVTGTGGNNSRLYGFFGNSDGINVYKISVSDDSEIAENKTIVAPSGSEFLLCNMYSDDATLVKIDDEIVFETELKEELEESEKKFALKVKSEIYGEVIFVDETEKGNIEVNSVPNGNYSITANNANLIDLDDFSIGSIDSITGENIDGAGNVRSNGYIAVNPNSKLIMSTNVNVNYLRLSCYDKSMNHLRRLMNTSYGVKKYLFDIGEDVYYVRWSANVANVTNFFTKNVLQNIELMLSYFDYTGPYVNCEYNSINVVNGEIIGVLQSYNGGTYITNDWNGVMYATIPTSITSIINQTNTEIAELKDVVSSYHYDYINDFGEDECRNIFRLAMQEKANALNLDNPTIGDGAGHPVVSYMKPFDVIKVLCNAMGYIELNNLWGYKNKIIRTKGVEHTILAESSTWNSDYIADLSDYYTPIAFKTGSAGVTNLVCACTSPELNGNVLVGVVSRNSSSDTAEANRYKLMKLLMDAGKTRLSDRNADVSSIETIMTNMGMNHSAVIVLPNCSPSLLNKVNFKNDEYINLYSYMPDTNLQTYSMIKLLCATTALDYIDDLDERVEIVYSDLLIGTGSSSPLFTVGEKVTYRELLYAMLLPSCNQASYVFERCVGAKILGVYGSESTIVTN